MLPRSTISNAETQQTALPNVLDMERLKIRQKSYKEKPLVLNGIDPVKVIESMKATEHKPYMSLYCLNLNSSQVPQTCKGGKGRRKQKKGEALSQDVSSLPPVPQA